MFVGNPSPLASSLSLLLRLRVSCDKSLTHINTIHQLTVCTVVEDHTLLRLILMPRCVLYDLTLVCPTLALSQSSSSCATNLSTHVYLHMTCVLLHLCVLGSCIKALTIEVMLISATLWLIFPRHPIQVPTIPMLLCPQVIPHEGTVLVHVCLALHAIALACLRVVAAHVCK